MQKWNVAYTSVVLFVQRWQNFCVILFDHTWNGINMRGKYCSDRAGGCHDGDRSKGSVVTGFSIHTHTQRAMQHGRRCDAFYRKVYPWRAGDEKCNYRPSICFVIGAERAVSGGCLLVFNQVYQRCKRMFVCSYVRSLVTEQFQLIRVRMKWKWKVKKAQRRRNTCWLMLF